MKVLNLQCNLKHDFEGWFGSEEDFRNQLSKEMIECPMCGNREITKMLSAPRLNFGASAPANEALSGSVETSANQTSTDVTGTSLEVSKHNSAREDILPANLDIANLDPKQLQKAWLKMVHHVMANSEDVGSEFASEARKIHYGETQERSIRGQATPDETQELLEEGIAVLSLPIPSAIKGTIQ